MTETQYRQALSRHDWFYQFSDDHSVWLRGEASRRLLDAARKELDPQGTIWNTFAPQACRISQQVAEVA